jgi:hypothetical protein
LFLEISLLLEHGAKSTRQLSSLSNRSNGGIESSGQSPYSDPAFPNTTCRLHTAVTYPWYRSLADTPAPSLASVVSTSEFFRAISRQDSRLSDPREGQSEMREHYKML